MLSAFPVPLSYPTLKVELQHFPIFLQLHPHFGHICVHMTALSSLKTTACVLLAVQKLVRADYKYECPPLCPGGDGYLQAHKGT